MHQPGQFPPLPFPLLKSRFHSWWKAAGAGALIACSPCLNAQLAPGSLDPDFDTASQRIAGAATGAHQVTDLQSAPDGGYFLTGTITDSGPAATTLPAITKLSSSGALDGSYGTNGTTVLERYTSADGRHVILPLANGKVQIASGRGFTLVLKRLNAQGILDSTFGIQSESRLTLAGAVIPCAMVVQPDGKLVVLGTSDGLNPPTTKFMFLARFLANGGVDTSFGIGGLAPISNASGSPRDANTLTFLPGGRFQIGGWTSTTSACLLTGRFNSDGSPDQQYASSGVKRSPALPVASIQALHRDLNGGFFAIAPTPGEPPALTLMHLTAEAELDTTFSDDGVVVTSFANTVLTALDIAQRSDGRIFVTGKAQPAADSSFQQTRGFVLRYKPDGDQEPAFNQSALLITSMGPSGSELQKLFVEGDKLVVAGRSHTSDSGPGFGFYGASRYQAGDLIINTAPQITQPPVSQSVNQGKPVEFGILTALNPLRSWVRWRRNNVILPNEHRLTLTFPSADWRQEGNYSVEVGNFAGSVSAAFTLAVHAPPKVTNSPAFAFLPNGTEAELRVTASGRLPMTYQWQRYDLNFGEPHTSSSETNTLIVPKHPGWEGDYRVIVTNADGAATSTRVSFKTPPEYPVVTEQPESREIRLEDTTTMRVTVSGRPPFTFQWQRNQVNYGDPISQISGTSTLAVPSTPEFAGSYRCIITSALGWTASQEATLTVWTDSTIRQQQPRILIRAGQPLELAARVFDYRPTRAFQWQRNNLKFTGGIQTVTETGSLGNGPDVLLNLNLPTATLAHAGNYRVLMTTVAGRTVSDTASVGIVDPTDRALSVALGKTVKLSVQTAGPGLYHTWRRVDGTPLTGPRFAGIHTRALTITKAAASDAGDYVCDVQWSSYHGPAVPSGRASLQVQTAPPAVINVPLPPGSLLRPYRYALNRENEQTRFAVTGLPPGLRYNVATSEITGAPLVAGLFNVKIVASNETGSSSPVTMSLAIAGLPPYVKGTFAGPIGGTGDDLGLLQLVVTASGSFTGKGTAVIKPGVTSSFIFTGRLVGEEGIADFVGTSSTFALPAGEPPYMLQGACRVELYWPAGEPTPVCHISSAQGGTIVVELFANVWNPVTNPATEWTGFHNMALTPHAPFSALGSGYATASTLASGSIIAAGKMPDGRSITCSTFLNADASFWMYAGLSTAAQGRLSGLATLSSSRRLDGTLKWVRSAESIAPPVPTGYAYLQDFTTPVTVRGGLYLPPNLEGVTGPFLLDALPSSDPTKAAISVTLSDGPLTSDFVIPGTVSEAHAVALSPPASSRVREPRIISVSFNAPTGLFTGIGEWLTYENAGSDRVVSRTPMTMQGVIIQPDAGVTRGLALGCFNYKNEHIVYDTDGVTVLRRLQLPDSGGVTILAP